MYHHRYQPPTHSANKTSVAYSSNYSKNSHHTGSSSNNHIKLNSHNNNIHNNHHTSSFGSYSCLPKHIAEERQDVIFRKVRGILNKITPETFDKLSKELVNVGLDSPRTLRGVIYLLFDKALKDLKYSSLYAKLCQELSERAPNFETEPGPNTFCRFLISKCEDEFERRRKATEDFDEKNELTDEEFELKAIAKQKMLGNIKFICELGKKRLLQEEILHECIRGLLSKKKERPIQDQAQDLECLSQIMRTIGSLLDIQASKNLMNQYFDRIDLFSRKPELPSRIRFMLRDVIDLRNNNWRLRPFQREDNVPQPLSKLREEAGYDPTANSTSDKTGNNRNILGTSDLSKLHGNKFSMLLDDEPSFTTSTDFHWGPSFLSMENSFDAFTSRSGEAKQNAPNQVPKTGPPLVKSAPFHMATSFHHSESYPEFRRFDRPNAPTGLNKNGDEVRKVADCPLPERRSLHNINSINPQHEKAREFQPENVRTRAPGLSTPPRLIHREEQVTRRSDTRQHHQVNQIGNSFNSNRPANHRFSNDANQPPYPQPVSRPGRYDFGSRTITTDSHENRERRFNRNDQINDTRHHRPPSQIIHRPNRNGPTREHHYFEKFSQPESDLNLNWRAGPLTKPNPATHDIKHGITSQSTNIKVIPSPRLTEKLDEPKSIDERPTVIIKQQPVNHHPHDRQDGIDSSNHEKRLSFERGVEVERTVKEVTSISSHSPIKTNGPILQLRQESLPSSDKMPEKTQSTIRVQNPNPTRSAPRHLKSLDINPSLNPLSTIQQSNHPSLRNSQVESFDKREQRKYNPPFSHDREQSSRHNGNGSLAQERDHRSPVKTSSIENANISDTERISNWRRGLNIVPNVVTTCGKEQSNTTPILLKPPIKISDTNMSLRPSHNLVGRANVQVQAPTQIKMEQTPKSNLESNDQTHTRNQPTNRFLPDGNQAQTTAMSTISAKMEPGSTTESTNKPESNNDSPSKAAARELHVNKFILISKENISDSSFNVNITSSKIKDLKIPKSYQHDCLASLIKQSISKCDTDRENANKLIVQLVPMIFETSSVLNAFKIIFEQMHSLEVETPKVKSLVSEFLSNSVFERLVNLEDVGRILSGGKHHPLFLLFLQKLEKQAGQAWLNDKFLESKINLMDMLPEVDRSKDRLACVLKDRCLGFLNPMLTIEPDLWEQMRDRDPSPVGVYRWIKDNVDPTLQATPTFAHVLITCLLKYIHNSVMEKSKKAPDQTEGSETPQSNKSSPTAPSQSTSDLERELLSRYQQILQAILKSKQMQMGTLYALQSFYHGLDFPKGSLLRWFHMLYDMNIVDDDIFFTWKEEINDEFPGKGQALFQVNTWLNWLAEPDSDEEEDV